MDYSKYSIDELEEMLDNAVENYANGDMHHSTYTIVFNEVFEALTAKKQPERDSVEEAYKRAMQGVF